MTCKKCNSDKTKAIACPKPHQWKQVCLECGAWQKWLGANYSPPSHRIHPIKDKFVQPKDTRSSLFGTRKVR